MTLPETVTEIWVTVDKTAEADADNLLTVRLQAQVNSVWFDIGWDEMHTSAATTASTDVASGTTRAPNIFDGATPDGIASLVAYYKNLPTNVVRIISISSGTTVANTFSADAEFRFSRS